MKGHLTSELNRLGFVVTSLACACVAPIAGFQAGLNSARFFARYTPPRNTAHD